MPHTVMTETKQIVFRGVDPEELARVLTSGVDHGGNVVEPFTDADGGWPLRCCLQRSQPGDEIAIIAWSPFDWHGPYRETGPVVVHTRDCAGIADPIAELPHELDATPMTLRPYGPDHRIAYDHVRHIGCGHSLTREVEALLEIDGIEMVHGRNVRGGCWAFTAQRR